MLIEQTKLITAILKTFTEACSLELATQYLLSKSASLATAVSH